MGKLVKDGEGGGVRRRGWMAVGGDVKGGEWGWYWGG